VQEVTRRRRAELSRIVDTTPEAWQEPVTTALRSLAVTAGEVPESEWWLGWHDARAVPAADLDSDGTQVDADRAGWAIDCSARAASTVPGGAAVSEAERWSRPRTGPRPRGRGR
jgi:hypothetical protein